MKVLALNSSPRSQGESKTELMLSHLVQGMKEAGADVEAVELRKKKINNCIGCFTCWTKSPGRCIHKDDMTGELFPKWLESDLAVYASPLYHFTVNATMKAFIERTLPVLEPFFEKSNQGTKHPLRRKHPAVVVLSVAGFPEGAVFDQLSSWANYVFGAGLVAEIYRPAAGFLSVAASANKAREILEATTQAGRELIQSMKVSSETMARLKQLIPEDKETFRTMGNLMWKTCIAEGITPKEFAERGLVPRPDSIETFMLIMSQGFKPDAAGDTRATIQFHFSGEIEGSCHLKIAAGRMEACQGVAEDPDLTIQAPFDTWMDITTGRANGQQLFLRRKYQVAGDFSLLMKMRQLFRK